jgi:hypothetical protein
MAARSTMRGLCRRRGKEFFVALVQYLQENVDALRSQLQGDLTASETRVQTSRADEVKITRSRFPWVDARLTHHGDTITLEYAKGPGSWRRPDDEDGPRDAGVLRSRLGRTTCCLRATRLRSRGASTRSRRSWRGG